MQFRTILTLIPLIGALSSLPACAQSSAAMDDTLVQMGQAFKNNNSRRLTELLPSARGHVLEPWAAYWELRARLDSASGQEISDFFMRYAGTYQEDRLRNDWLLLLGQRRDWLQFAQVLPGFRMNDDREVRCYTLVLEHLVSGLDRSEELKVQWYRQKEPGDACFLAAKLHHDAGKLDADDVWRKARLAVDARQLRTARLAAALLVPSAADRSVSEALNNPERFLLKTTPTRTPLTQELAVLALARWADSNPDGAAQALTSRWASHLSESQRAFAWGAIGKQATFKLSPDAMGYFSNAGPQRMIDDHLTWRTRAALRQNQWTDALQAIEAMSQDSAAEATWVYWRARALMQPGRTESERATAQHLLQTIADSKGFYEMLALEALGQAITTPPPPPRLTPEEKNAARANPGLQRALAAIRLGLRSEGVKEWNYTTNLHQSGGMNDRELLAAAELACSNEVWDRCINTSERTRSVTDITQRFPMPHQTAVVTRSRSIGLDPAYVYGLIRQESRFITDARSGVGASGLMQVMPATARWTARKIGLTDFAPHQITDRDTNIAIGTGYLKLVLDDFAGSMPMAAAAYNAGPGRPRIWRGLPGSPTLEAAVWAETIPFSETRDYVKKVLSNTTMYAAIISGTPQSLLARLSPVGPRDFARPENTELP